jgi:hypothetical protein
VLPCVSPAAQVRMPQGCQKVHSHQVYADEKTGVPALLHAHAGKQADGKVLSDYNDILQTVTLPCAMCVRQVQIGGRKKEKQSEKERTRPVCLRAVRQMKDVHRESTHELRSKQCTRKQGHENGIDILAESKEAQRHEGMRPYTTREQDAHRKCLGAQHHKRSYKGGHIMIRERSSGVALQKGISA